MLLNKGEMIGRLGFSPKTVGGLKTSKNVLITDGIRRRSYNF
jgi:hypothetical protein